MRRLVCAVAFLSILSACDGRPRAGGGGDEDVASSRLEGHVAEIDLRGGAPEHPQGSLFSSDGGKSFADLTLELRGLTREGNAKGVFVRIGSSFSLARAEEIGRLLAAARDKKLPVVCHADGYSNATLLAAAAGCSEIWLSPAGSVDAVGIAAQLIFAHALFDKLGVQVDFMQQGRFKGAEEPFTRDAPSDDARSSLETALHGLRKAWIDGVEHGRSSSADALGLEDGPYTAADAKDKKLIDAVGFEAEARERAYALAGVKKRLSYFGGAREEPAGFGDVMRSLSGSAPLTVPHVAIVRATGAITMSGSSGLGGESGISQRELAPLLRKLARDPATKAVVLRIDSPGGSALASDLIWREVTELRKQKPVIASVGGMAASGGYYIASACNKIVAEKSSIVGSIGVVMGKLAVGKSLDQLGVHVTVVPAKEGAGARATYMSALTPWDEPTRAKLEHAMKATYQLFLERVAAGRGIDVSDVAPAAEGRIMGGEDGKALKLVDEVGGLGRAIDLALELAKLDAQTPAHVERAPSGLFDLFGGGGDAEGARRLGAREALLGPLGPRIAGELAPFAALVEPLADGEHALAAMPFSLTLR